MIWMLSGGNKNLFMVGDEDQSIYGFRAACPQILTSFERVYPNAKVLLMESNYRSREEIVETADRFIQKNKKRHKKHINPTREAGGSVKHIPVKNRAGQYAYLIKIAENCEEQTAILYRNHESAIPLIDMLERRNISYRLKNTDTAFFSHPIVNDICDYIAFAERPWDTEIFFRIYYKMGAGISKNAALYAIDHQIGKTPLLKMIAEDGDVSYYTQKQCRLLERHFSDMQNEDAGKAIYRIIYFMGYGEYMDHRGMDRAKADILRIIGSQEQSLWNFPKRLERLQEIMKNGQMDPSCKLTLSTIHSSKGLEYDRVYMADVMDGILPQTKEGEDQDLYEEERRLFYVGMTRAKNTLGIFTFTNGMESSFTKEILAAGKKRGGITLKKGMWIRHLKFGRGKIIECEKETITVAFVTGMTKKLNISVMMEHHMITAG